MKSWIYYRLQSWYENPIFFFFKKLLFWLYAQIICTFFGNFYSLCGVFVVDVVAQSILSQPVSIPSATLPSRIIHFWHRHHHQNLKKVNKQNLLLVFKLYRKQRNVNKPSFSLAVVVLPLSSLSSILSTMSPTRLDTVSLTGFSWMPLELATNLAADSQPCLIAAWGKLQKKN